MSDPSEESEPLLEEDEESEAQWYSITTTTQPMPYSEVFLRETQYTKSIEEDVKVLSESGFIIDLKNGFLGAGCFGSVFKGMYGPQAEGLTDDKYNTLRNVQPNLPFVAKVVDFLAKVPTLHAPHVGVADPQEKRESYESEKLAMTFINHPNVTPIRMAINMGEPKTFTYAKNRQKSFVQHDRVYLIMDFAELGPLKNYINDPLQSSQRIKLVRDCFAGLRYLHSQGVTHGDIHLDNVLIFREEGEVIAKWTDFGKSFVSGRGEQSYDSPERKAQILRMLTLKIRMDCQKFAGIIRNIWIKWEPELEPEDTRQVCERHKQINVSVQNAKNLDEVWAQFSDILEN